jgi:hypothetical protein
MNPVYVSPSTGITYVYNSSRMRFYDAANTCRQHLGGYLVMYLSAARQYEIEMVFRQRYVLRPEMDPFYWIGLAVKKFDFWPAFSWSSGSPLGARAYSHWGRYGPGQHPEPNNVFPPEDCAVANYTQAYDGTWGWSDEDCEMEAPFMCEVPLPTPPPPTPAPPAKLLGYTTTSISSSTGGARYVYNSSQLDYFAAKATCASMRGTLVVYNSLQEQNEVEQSLIKQGALEQPYYKFYWMGYQVLTMWPSFTAAASGSTYRHWGRMQPDQKTGLELCAGANYSLIYQGAWGWSDEPCGLRAPFICKLPPYSPPPRLSSPPPAPKGDRGQPPSLPAFPPFAPVSPPPSPPAPPSPRPPRPSPPPSVPPPGQPLFSTTGRKLPPATATVQAAGGGSQAAASKPPPPKPSTVSAASQQPPPGSQVGVKYRGRPPPKRPPSIPAPKWMPPPRARQSG